MNLTPITRNIIIINVVVYILANFLSSGWVYQYFSAYYPFSPNFRIWQVITHMFMHANFNSGTRITHILFNMFTLASFGPVLEHILGNKRYLILYFFSGIGAFLIFNLYNFYEINNLAAQLNQMGIDSIEIFRMADFSYKGSGDIEIKNDEQLAVARELFMALQVPMVGASGAIFGVMAAFTMLFPEAKLMFLFIPFSIKAKFLLPLIIAVSLYLGISGNMSGIAHFAHIGGALVGFIMAFIWRKNQFKFH